MTVTGLANEIYLELGSPSDLATGAIAFWAQTNVGALNSFINSNFAESGGEIYETGVIIAEQESAILKKMYMVHYYDLKLKSNIVSLASSDLIEVSDDHASVKKVNKNEINRVIAQIKKQEYDELQKLINAYKLSKYKPYQVTGDDTEKGSFGYTKYNTDYNRIGNFS